jgi:hypothetical protein
VDFDGLRVAVTNTVGRRTHSGLPPGARSVGGGGDSNPRGTYRPLAIFETYSISLTMRADTRSATQRATLGDVLRDLRGMRLGRAGCGGAIAD